MAMAGVDSSSLQADLQPVDWISRVNSHTKHRPAINAVITIAAPCYA